MELKSKKILDRRKQFVPNAIGIFNPSTAVSAKGAIIIDADGREMIDFAGGIGVVNAGHCPPPVVKAIADQAAQLIHCSFNVASYDLYMQLAEKLATLFPHGDHTKVMLTNSGAESVENAIKIARQATSRQAVICYGGAFHGRTMMSMTLTSKVGYKLGCGPFAPEVYRIPFPDYYRYGNGMDLDQFSDVHLRELEDFFHTNVPAEQVAAIIIEPVQGEGGFNVVPQKYLKGLRRVCDKYGIMLILDEVQSGFGRTGKWAAYQHYGVTPDISTWAKSMGSGMPIGAVIGKAAIMDACKPSTIGGTYPGNPVCCAASLATIKYMEEIDINALGERIGNIVRERFNAFKQQFSAIGDVRGLGAMMAFELVKDNDPFQPDAELCKKLIAYCADNGLIVINAGVNGNVIRVLSPLVIEEELLHKGLDIIEGGLHQLLGDQVADKIKN
ncbi:aspartate aminotransferase family protein [Mucilaginibacter sp. X5P1]|uniref:aspartate aminotransferase family protein n=1 Tax=Mucilaginibacter sp. X5P1 TaxID=2723088 RepID=UPI0016128B65|nr:aminotransferase class III-fold pyridoxal phosphate-dependent enzyme [Mucilaginibacter sp. X5P1]MBB6137191.1 4-aminobutyrate aminotransferase/(S)-3-amino-2-methylpropionate transaminase [Mucilaginibacter sp. X5P1]